jgi:branched-chain amino acid transport system substrate-binding protein
MFSADLLKGAGFPAVDGWYATQASPHLTDDAQLADWVKRFRARFNNEAPEDYTICNYDAAWVIINAVKGIVAKGKTPTREAVRDAIQGIKITTLQGPVEFDENGDIKNRVVSVFQIKKDDKMPLDDPSQYKYVGVAPMA